MTLLRKIMEPARVLLAPLAVVHGLVLHVRHVLFDAGLFSSKKTSTPTVVVGNLNVGGSGKTPFTEWLVQHLSQDLKVAVLSRGYGRSTSGFRMVEVQHTASDAGDEPLQIKQRFPQVPVAVCEDRLAGIAHLTQTAAPDVIVLDDAYQHRKLQGHFNVLLTPATKPWFKDHLMPWGGLRDLKRARKRAHAVVITKLAGGAQLPSDWTAKLNVDVPVYGAALEYAAPRPEGHTTALTACAGAVAVSALAAPGLFEDHVSGLFPDSQAVRFRDHHGFTASDFARIQGKIGTFENGPVAVLTTEKDWTKLRPLQQAAPSHWRFFVIPVALHLPEGEALLKQVRQTIH